MVVDARWAVVSISETTDLLRFPNHHHLWGFTENGPKKRKYPVSSRCVDQNALLMWAVKGKWLQRAEPQTKWAAAASANAVSWEQENEATIHTNSTKLDNRRLGKCCWSDQSRFPLQRTLQMVGLEIGLTWKHGYIPPCINGSAGVMAWGIFSWHTLGPLVLTEPHFNWSQPSSVVAFWFVHLALLMKQTIAYFIWNRAESMTVIKQI